MARQIPAGITQGILLTTGTLATSLNGSSAITISGIRQSNGETLYTADANQNVLLNFMVNGSSTGARLCIDATVSSSGRLRIGGRSVGADGFQATSGATALSTTSYQVLTAIIDYANDYIEVFIDGVSDGSASVTFGNSELTLGTPSAEDGIGCVSVANDSGKLKGYLGELSIWNVRLSTDEIAALGDRVNPALVCPTALAHYWPLAGSSSTIPDVVGGKHGAVTGTISEYTIHPLTKLFINPIWDGQGVSAVVPGGDPEGSLIGGKLIRGGLLLHGVLGR